jgi:hypothetical protein
VVPLIWIQIEALAPVFKYLAEFCQKFSNMKYALLPPNFVNNIELNKTYCLTPEFTSALGLNGLTET